MTPRKNPAAVSLGRRGGRVVSPAKSDAARANGAKGGRPRTHCRVCRRPVRTFNCFGDCARCAAVAS